MADAETPKSWREYPHFIENETIQALGHETRWTISTMNAFEVTNGRTGEKYTLPEKTPVDAREALRNGSIRGAWSIDEQCLMTLDELNASFEYSTNSAFYLSAQIDGVVVLDIEPACPPAIRDELLSLPGALYTEVSTSGLGYHLVMPLPDNFYDFPAGAGKKKLQDDRKHYEILIDHWITFSRKPIDPAMSIARPSSNARSWEDVYADLAENATQATFSDFELETNRPDTPYIEVVLEVAKQLIKPYHKTLDDFHGDYSRWEFGCLGYLYNRILSILNVDVIAKGHDWTQSDKTWLLYEVATQMLPRRDKHLEMRNQMPYLLYVASSMVGRRSDD